MTYDLYPLFSGPVSLKLPSGSIFPVSACHLSVEGKKEVSVASK